VAEITHHLSHGGGDQQTLPYSPRQPEGCKMTIEQIEDILSKLVPLTLELCSRVSELTDGSQSNSGPIDRQAILNRANALRAMSDELIQSFET